VSVRRLRTLLQREVRATLRDPFTVSVLVAVPMVALLVFSFVLSTEVVGLRLGVLDASASRASRRIVAELAAAGTFETVPFARRDELEHALVAGRISAGLVIPPDFDRGLLERERGGAAPEVQVLYDGAETILAGNAEAFLEGLVTATGARLAARDLRAPGAADGGGARGGGVEVVVRALFNPSLDGTPFMVAGTFGFVLSFLTTLITAVAIVNERLGGTFDQLQLTPATNLEILLGKLLPLGAMFALDVALMVGVAGLLLGVWPRGSALFFIGVSGFYVLTSLAMGLFFSATSATAAEAVQKTVLASIPLVQISGFAFPIRNMPWPVQWFAELIPATHYIRVSRAIYLRGAGPLELLPELALLALFGALLIAVALRSLARRT
jgi:ABC-2 type transport system permease protein